MSRGEMLQVKIINDIMLKIFVMVLITVMSTFLRSMRANHIIMILVKLLRSMRTNHIIWFLHMKFLRSMKTNHINMILIKFLRSMRISGGRMDSSPRWGQMESAMIRSTYPWKIKTTMIRSVILFRWNSHNKKNISEEIKTAMIWSILDLSYKIKTTKIRFISLTKSAMTEMIFDTLAMMIT